MGGLLINPGTGPVDGGSEEQAVANGRQLLVDAGLEGEVEVVGFNEGFGATRIGGGRWKLVLVVAEGSRARARADRIRVDMPGLPLEDVRPVPGDRPPPRGRSPVRFPRIYVEGSSWWWLGVSMLVDDE